MTTGAFLAMALHLSTAASDRHGAGDLQLHLQRLSVTGTVLYVAAHPDDENTRLLATFANEYGLRSAYLAFTRGEGGQNLIGSELGPLLGIIRTQELLAARRIDGAEQYFTRARDFGYSKSVDETLKIWDHDKVLADAVKVMRELRPDVVITRFPLESNETHGHHVASARLALEAFTKAADPRFAPELGAPWQAKRIFWNAWSPDRGVKLPDDALHLDSSPYNPLLGMTFGELAAISRSQHKSQGFGAAPVHGPSEENFVLLGGTPGKSVFDGVDLTWKRVPGSDKVAALFKQAATEFKPANPSASVPVLLQALEELRKLPDSPLKARKLDELTEVIAECAGLFVEAAAAQYALTPGDAVEVTLNAFNRGTSSWTIDSAALAPNKPWTKKITLTAGNAVSNPYWLEVPPAAGTWTVEDAALIGKPELPPLFHVDFKLASGGHEFTLTRPVVFKWVEPTMGERYRPIEVLPKVAVNLANDVLVFTDPKPKELTVKLHANADAQSGTVELELPDGWVAEPAHAPFTLAKKGDELEVKLKLRAARPTSPNGTAKVLAKVGSDDFTRGLIRVDYPHIPAQVMLPPAEVKLVQFELKRAANRIGYIDGAGDDVAKALRQAGYEVTLLSDEALTNGKLDYDAIVIGIRAFNVNPKLPQYRARLMKYVEGGGTLIAQYNTKNWVSNVPAEIGPYPFEISQERVTDETAEITFEPANAKVLNQPNKLSPSDFNGWVQERGLYFAGKWDDKYATPFSMHDPGEPPRKGSLLIAHHGKGIFVYTGIAFFRQLPAGVPGAYRLFANLLAHGY